MRIGVDIDDTISFTHKKLIEAALEYDENYVNGKGFKNKNGSTFMEVFYWNVYNVDGFLHSIRNNKFYLDLEVKENANKYITKLFSDGHEIYFITKRDNSFFTKMKTKKWLKKNGFKYNKLFIGIRNKSDICEEHNIDLFIDNDYKNIEDALAKGIDSLLMIDDFNKERKDLKSVKNWKEIYDYINGVK